MTSGVHDMGGAHHDAPINVPDHVMSDWERLADAVNLTLVGKGLWRVDEMRRAQEQIPPEQYLAFSYYERWIGGMERLLAEKGVLTGDEIDRRTAEIGERWGR